MQEPLIEPEDLAKRWKITPLTLAQWRWTGRGPRFMKMGHNTFYRAKDVEAFEEQKAQRSTTHKNDDHKSNENRHFEPNLEIKLKNRRKRIR